MAHKKAGGSTRNGRESHSKRLGVKKFGGESRARRQHPGPPARHHDARRRQRRHRHRPHAVAPSRGRVKFAKKGAERRTFVSVDPQRLSVQQSVSERVATYPSTSIQDPGHRAGVLLLIPQISAAGLPHEIRRRSTHQGHAGNGGRGCVSFRREKFVPVRRAGRW